MSDDLPYRSAPRAAPSRRPPLPLPPAKMPLLRAGRPLKRWRYVAAFCEQAMVCAAVVHIGPFRQSFWAVWDRRGGRLHERTRTLGPARVRVEPGRLQVRDAGVRIDLALDEDGGVETVCAHGGGYVWTRKQAGIAASGTLALAGEPERELAARAVVDDTAGYHARETEWWWAAGVGAAGDGTPLAWNLVAGVNDPPQGSERTVWVSGRPREVAPVSFSAALDLIGSTAGELRFEAEAQRSHRDRLGPIRSDYRQPFGRFVGTLPDGSELAHGLGVTEHHVARW